MLTLFLQFKRLVTICISAPGGRISLLLYGLAIALNLGSVYAAVRLVQWTGEFYSAIEKVNGPEVLHQIGIFALIIAANSARGLSYEYLRKVLEIRWRRALTDHAIALWTRNKAFWHMAADPIDRIDNPDQRIAEDCRLFARGLLVETVDLIGEVVGLFSYLTVLWGLSNFALSLAPIGIDFDIPRYMVWAAFLYVAISSLITHQLGRPLKGVLAEQQHREASFRFSMARWRTAFDEVALSNGEEAEKRQFRQRFDDLAENWRRLIRAELVLGSFTFPFRHSVLRIPLFVALPGYLTGHVAFGGLMQLSMAFSQVVTTLSWFIFSYRDLAELVATASRLDGFLQAAERHGSHKPVIARSLQEHGGCLRQIEVMSSDGRTLLRLPDITLASGDTLLLRGRSGVGKTTLVKTLAGFWPHGSGNLAIPDSEPFFLPQKAYFPLGSLEDAAAYPARIENFDADAVQSALADVGLTHLLGKEQAGSDGDLARLSGGELQRLALARLLLHRPSFAVLDEATSSLDEASETALLQTIRSRLPDTILILIAHRLPQSLHKLKIHDLDLQPTLFSASR
ncbi:SbmA/BacA-like family transporter [Rhizobium sp. 18065]|uniref:ABC transporter ATP-binding protein/permease n=1 Tax=Rhizobium sp. 18065 TaxID=2681411 RepID=UPI00135C0B94|nr:SbmA/BacA-like family transporter [Rhizobium sp. 18065]